MGIPGVSWVGGARGGGAVVTVSWRAVSAVLTLRSHARRAAVPADRCSRAGGLCWDLGWREARFTGVPPSVFMGDVRKGAAEVGADAAGSLLLQRVEEADSVA